MSKDDVPDWEAKYWANREKQLASQKSTGNTSLSPRMPSPAIPQGYPEIDPVQMMQQRMMQGMMHHGQSSSGSRSAYLREGDEYFRHIQGGDGFGNVIPLVRSMGRLNGMTGREFAILGETRGILVDGMQMVDMSKVNENPDRIRMYVRVRAPFVGDILVDKNTVIETQQNSGKQILRG